MTSRHEHLREALGAYTLGALDSDERSEVEIHLRDCAACRDELAGLAVLPDLLGRLGPDEVEAFQQPDLGADLESALAAIARERRRLRRSLWTWRVAAAVAAAALAVATLMPARDSEPAVAFEPRPVVAEASDTRGQVHVTAQPWGMRITIEVRDLPARNGYGLWAVRDDGHRALAASWSAPPDDDAVRLEGSCYVSVDDLVRFEVITPDEEVLLTFDPA